MLLLLLPKIRAGLIYIRYAANAVGGGLACGLIALAKEGVKRLGMNVTHLH